ncbi:MAG: PAS domain S-box protein [Gemmatimonadetes bacterium]|nr:PAS domain S-box protein [Gemmatimonadota bacterium]
MSASEPVSDVRSDARPSLELLLELSRDLVCSLTGRGDFIRVSDSCARITGFAPVLLAGQPFVSFVHPLDRELAERAFARVRERGFADDVPTRFRTAAGGHVSLRWTAAHDAHGGQVFMIAREMKHERERTARRRARAALKAAASEREQLRADLHDGLLQTLTGASFKLGGALRLLETDRPAAQRQLEDVARLLQQEQRELRFLVEEMKQGWLERTNAPGPSLFERLTDFARRLHATWDIQLLCFTSGPGTLPERLVRPVFGIVHEAVVNAARHGQATAASVHVDLAEDHVRLRISDNGRGLSFTGTLDNAALRAQDLGPAVLKHRVWSLGGSLGVESQPQGAVVAIRIPFEDDS